MNGKPANILAQDIMDLYYGDYKSDDQFYDIDFFLRQVQYSYDALLKEEYEKQRRELRQDNAMRELLVSFDTTWLSREEHVVKEDRTIELKASIFSFPFDNSNVGLQDIVPLDNDVILARGTESERWETKYFPKDATTVMWWGYDKNKIEFAGTSKVGKVHVLYVPAFSGEIEIGMGLSEEIQRRVLNVMLGAKNQTIIDTVNDGNIAQTKETEINRNQLKQ